MTTRHFQVVSRSGLNVRTAPRINTSKVVGAGLGYGDILEVNASSQTIAMNYEWWEHTHNAGWWSAARKIAPEDVYMVPHQLPYDDRAAETRTFEIMVDGLRVRNQPRLGSTLVSGQSLRRGQRLEFGNRAEADGFIWWEQVEQPGWWSASGSQQGGQTYMLPITDDDAEAAVSLNVPWISQIQLNTPNLPNDCGHSCMLMTMRYHGCGTTTSVADLYALPHKNANGTTNKTHLKLIMQDGTQGQLSLTDFGMPATTLNLEGLQDRLKDDQPVTVLVWYPSLGFNNPSSGNFNHWVVLTGYTGDVFYLNDPLWTTENAGAMKAITRDSLLAACDDSGSGLYGVY